MTAHIYRYIGNRTFKRLSVVKLFIRMCFLPKSYFLYSGKKDAYLPGYSTAHTCWQQTLQSVFGALFVNF